MISIPPQSPEEAVLEQAMAGRRPPVGPALEGLLLTWLEITSARQPGQSHPLRFPFLKWALHGRAADVLAQLRKSPEPKAKELVAEIERIADFPFPPKNEKAREQAMEIWAWLKKELRGRVE